MRSLGLFVALGLVAGCAHHGADVKVASKIALGDGAGTHATARGGGDASAAGGGACSGDSACGEGELCIDGRCGAIATHLAACGQARVHFAFDSSSVDDGERAALQRSARCLRADQGMHLTIEGDADERGTDEYNMALGDKRAVQVAGYLKALGVSDRQLRTVSYGSEKPLCAEHDEACWSQNRRAELKLGHASAAPSPRRR